MRAELRHEAKEAEIQLEESIDAPPQWNELPDLVIKRDRKEEMLGGLVKHMRNEVSQGGKKQQKEDYIQASKKEHPLSREAQKFLFRGLG